MTDGLAKEAGKEESCGLVSGTGYSSLRQGRQKKKQQGSGKRKEGDGSQLHK